MLPLLPFAAGLLTGAVAVGLFGDEKAKNRLDKVQDCLREATVSGLGTIEQSMARLRGKLQTPPPAAAHADDTDAPAAKTATKPVHKPAAKRGTSARPKAAAGDDA
ncbi:MAG: hypothetical protein LBU46_02165 [Candidatus Accumulibacter sp.]|jgi:hypothetical protein|nr:hypothetical protein [Accumulibacter sp.]